MSSVTEARTAGVHAAMAGGGTGVMFIAAAAMFDVDSKLWRVLVGVTIVGMSAAAALWSTAQQTATEAGYWFKPRRWLARLCGFSAALGLVVALAFWDVDAPWWRATIAAIVVLVCAAVYAVAPPSKTSQ